MASKSSAENIATSGAESNMEDRTQLENPSAAEPSGTNSEDISKTVTFKSCAPDNLKESLEIREDHVNVGLGNGSGSSDCGDQVLNAPEKNGSSDHSSEGNLTDPADTIRAAHEAANIARDAAASCRKTLHDSYNVIKFCNKRCDSSNRKARAAARIRHASRYRSLAENYRMASQRVELLIIDAEHSAELADTTADNADHSATKLAEIVDVAPEAIGDRQYFATTTTKIAKSRAVTAYQKKHLLLKGVKQSWEDVNSTEFLRTKSTVSLSDDRKCIKIGSIVFALISAVLGLTFLTVPQFAKINQRTHDALIALGTLLLVTSSLISMYRLLRCIYKQRKAGKRKRRREMAASIEAELRILEDYFERNGITESPVLAESQG